MVVRGLCALCVAAAVFSNASTAAERELRLGADVAGMVGAQAVTERNAEGETETFWRVGENFEIYLSPTLPEGVAEKQDGRVVVGLGMREAPSIASIARVVYETRTGKTDHNVNVMLAIFTIPGSDPALGKDDAAWFQRRIHAEPLYIRNFGTWFEPDRWVTFGTDDPVAPLGFYDPNHGPAGYAQPPTLEQLQNARSYEQVWSQWWRECGSRVPEDSYRYGNMAVGYFALMTAGEGYWKNFKGDLKRITITTLEGESITVHFGSAGTAVTAAATPSNNLESTAPHGPKSPAASNPLAGPAKDGNLNNPLVAAAQVFHASTVRPKGMSSEDVLILVFVGVGVGLVLLAGLLHWKCSRQPVRHVKRVAVR